MKTTFKAMALLTTVLMLAACAHTPVPQPSASPMASPIQPTKAATSVQTVAPSAQSTEPSLPLPTENLAPDLPAPGLWASSLRIDAKDYPRVDGSTATIPLGVYLRSKITGESLGQSLSDTNFTKTSPAWLALAGRSADLLVVYEAPDEIKQQLEGTGVKLTAKPIGLDALVFLTNNSNPVNNLTQKQIVSIYAGKTKKWNQVGGADTDIIPYQRTPNSGSQALMLKLVMKGKRMMDATSMMQPGDMDDLVDDIASYANTSNALGYSVYYYVRNMYQVPNVKLLSIDGIEPNSDTIASGSYPYINPFYAVIRKDEPADSPAHKLFDWLTGAEGKRAITDAGYVAAK